MHVSASHIASHRSPLLDSRDHRREVILDTEGIRFALIDVVNIPLLAQGLSLLRGRCPSVELMAPTHLQRHQEVLPGRCLESHYWIFCRLE